MIRSEIHPSLTCSYMWAWHLLAYLSFLILWAIYEACQKATCHKPYGSVQQRAVSPPLPSARVDLLVVPRDRLELHTIVSKLTPLSPTAMNREVSHQMLFSTSKFPSQVWTGTHTSCSTSEFPSQVGTGTHQLQLHLRAMFPKLQIQSTSNREKIAFVLNIYRYFFDYLNRTL